MERKITGKRDDDEAGVGKVLGGFLSSAFVHSFAAHTVLGGWKEASGEAWFFAGNGVAVVVEEGVCRLVLGWRKRKMGKDQGPQDDLKRWYDGIVGRIWWISVLLYTGRNFARGWVAARLVKEISGF